MTRLSSATPTMEMVVTRMRVPPTVGSPPGAEPLLEQQAEAPDQRDDREDEQAGDHVVLEHDTADGGEGYRRPRPGQRRALERQAGVAILGFARPGAGRLVIGHRSAETSRTIAEMIAIPAIVAARIHGMTERGSGSPRRSARWFRIHSP